MGRAAPVEATPPTMLSDRTAPAVRATAPSRVRAVGSTFRIAAADSIFFGSAVADQTLSRLASPETT